MNNKYSITMTTNGNAIDISDRELFTDMFETFLKYLENALQFKHKITDPELKYGDMVIADKLSEIVYIGIALGNYNLMICKPGGDKKLINVMTFEELVQQLTHYNAIDEDVHFYIVDNHHRVYDVIPEHTLRKDLYSHIVYWNKMIDTIKKRIIQYDDFVINPILEQPIDTKWAMQYHLHIEVKKALELIDSNPTEAKRLLTVMDYMLNLKGNCE